MLVVISVVVDYEDDDGKHYIRHNARMEKFSRYRRFPNQNK